MKIYDSQDKKIRKKEQLGFLDFVKRLKSHEFS